MPKYYTALCLALVVGLAYASARGVVYSSVLTGTGVAAKSSSHYHK